MSNHLITAAYKADLKTPMRKAVMVLLADKASDDGSGIWASKQTMADELCCSKQAVITTIKAFLDEGLLVEVGQRKSATGYTNCYAIVPEKLTSMALVRCWADKEGSTRLTGQPPLPVNEVEGRGQPPLPKPSRTPQGKAKASPSGGAGKTFLPSDWTPTPIAELPPKAKACAEQWTEESYATHGEAFVSYWTSRRGKMGDWRLTWANRIVALHSQVMRDQKFGNAPAESAKPAQLSDGDRRAHFDRLVARAERSRSDEDWAFVRSTAKAYGFPLPANDPHLVQYDAICKRRAASP